MMGTSDIQPIVQLVLPLMSAPGGREYKKSARLALIDAPLEQRRRLQRLAQSYLVRYELSDCAIAILRVLVEECLLMRPERSGHSGDRGRGIVAHLCYSHDVQYR